jgi:putative transcriptional regulator
MYHYNECGLRNVWLKNGFKRVETPYGRGVSIDAIEDLHRVIVLELVMKPSKLAATEIRFLRKEMELSQASLAMMLGVSAQTLALWEKGKSRITAPSERLLRLVVKGHFEGSVAIRKMIAMLNDLDSEQNAKRFVFTERNKRWGLVG